MTGFVLKCQISKHLHIEKCSKLISESTSLNNLSSDIRWSLDLRWQRPDKSVGFYGMKEGLLMRSKDLPGGKIDWDGFFKTERHEIYNDKLVKVSL